MKKILLLLISLTIFGCLGCFAENRKAVYRKITPAKAREIMQSADDFTLIDVRTENEYNQNRIDGAVLIPVDELAKRAEPEIEDKNALVFVYCHSGRRSDIAANTLVELGYTNVYDTGGIIDWQYEIED